jgi:hypothetical protein
MSNLCFFTDKKTANYSQAPFLYKYRKGPLAFNGKYIHSNYIYWILYNNNIKNIKLVTHSNEVEDNDILFFHYDYRDSIDQKRNFTKIQIVSDRPKLNWADYFCISDPSQITDKDFILYEPIPLGINVISSSFPPTNFHTNTAEFYLLDEFKNQKLLNDLKKEDINITFEFNKHVTTDPIDVFFFIRNKNFINLTDKAGNNKHTAEQGYLKHPCRLFQSWIMETPGIFSNHTSMNFYRKTDYDFLEANTFEEFYEKCIFLKKNKDFFMTMIANCRTRKTEVTNNCIVEQIQKIERAIK